MAFTSALILAALCLTIPPAAPSRLPYEARLELAKDHIRRMEQSALCFRPSPRVVLVETEELRVLPSATILHRCGPASGCCDSPLERCVARRKRNVPLYFVVMPQVGAPTTARMKVKRWVYANHTECHCRDVRTLRRRRRRTLRRRYSG